MATPCIYYLLSRLAVYAAAIMASWLLPSIHPFSALGSSWDGGWYIKIAQHGYPTHLFQEGAGSRWAFFPAWPLAIRGFGILTGFSLADAATILAFLFGLTSAITIWLAVQAHLGRQIADRAVLFYVFFPMALVLSMGYTEGLFLTAAGACLYAISRRWWLIAALSAIVGSLTRDAGAILIVAVVIAALSELRQHRGVRPTLAVLIAPLGLAVFMAYSWMRVGTPVAFLTAEKYWNGGAHFVWFRTPIVALSVVLRAGTHGVQLPGSDFAAIALVFAYVGITLMVRFRRGGTQIPTHWWIYTIGVVLVGFSAYTPTSILRYTMAAFPLFAAYSWKLKPKWDGAVVGLMACAQGALTIVVLAAFVHLLPIYP
ncbi:MAG TPA: mannosyltransferase family protein [Acidimicrobiales bacterium]